MVKILFINDHLEYNSFDPLEILGNKKTVFPMQNNPLLRITVYSCCFLIPFPLILYEMVLICHRWLHNCKVFHIKQKKKIEDVFNYMSKWKAKVWCSDNLQNWWIIYKWKRLYTVVRFHQELYKKLGIIDTLHRVSDCGI